MSVANPKVNRKGYKHFGSRSRLSNMVANHEVDLAVLSSVF
jgi:hypothetical protein